MRKTYYSHTIFLLLCMFASTLGPIRMQAKDKDESTLIERIKKSPKVLTNYQNYWYSVFRTYQIRRDRGTVMPYEDLYKLLKEEELAPIRAEVRRKIWKNVFFLFVFVMLSGGVVAIVGKPILHFLKNFGSDILEKIKGKKASDIKLFEDQIGSIAGRLGPLLEKTHDKWNTDFVKTQLEKLRDLFTRGIGRTGIQCIQLVSILGGSTYILPLLKNWLGLVKESFVLFCYDWDLLGYREKLTYNPMERIERAFIAAWHFLTYEQIASCIEYLVEARKDPKFLPRTREAIHLYIHLFGPKSKVSFDHSRLMYALRNYPPEMQEVARRLLLNLAIKSQQVGRNSAATDFVLLVGPPGTGKTEFVRITAAIAGAYLAEMSYTGLKDADIEGVAGNVYHRKTSIYATLFAQNRGKPIILLIDDIHTGVGAHGILDNMKHILAATGSSCLQHGRERLTDHAIPGGVPMAPIVFATANRLDLVPPELLSRALVINVEPSQERMTAAFYEAIFPRLLAEYSKAAIGPFGVNPQDFTEEELAAIPEKAKDFRELDRLARSLVLYKIEGEILKADGVSVINQPAEVAVAA
jgi:hypothetical protein